MMIFPIFQIPTAMGDTPLSLPEDQSNEEKFTSYIRYYYDWVRGTEDSIFVTKDWHGGFHLMHLWPMMISSCVKIDGNSIKVCLYFFRITSRCSLFQIQAR